MKLKMSLCYPKRPATLVIWACLLFMFSSFQASATMIGDSMVLDWRYPNSATHNVFSGGWPYSFTVDTGGTTFTRGFNPALTVTVAADTITIAIPRDPNYALGQIFGFSGGVPFNGAVFTDLTRSFLSAEIISVTAFPGFDASRVWVTGNELFLNFAGLTEANGVSSLSLRVATTNVPETLPAATGLAGAVLVLVGIQAAGRSGNRKKLQAQVTR